MEAVRIWSALAVCGAAWLVVGTPAWAQQADQAGAWWALPPMADSAASCAAESAVSRAMDVWLDAEANADSTELAPVFDGALLARNTTLVDQLARDNRRIYEANWTWWTPPVLGDGSQAVVYATSLGTSYSAEADATDFAQRPRASETLKSAFRVVHEEDGWRVVDETVFQRTSHPMDRTLMNEVAAAYHDLWMGLDDLYARGAVDQLDNVFSDQALAERRDDMQSLLAQDKIEAYKFSGSYEILDATPTDAEVLVEVNGTVDELQASTPRVLSAGAPWDAQVLHTLHKGPDGGWRIAREQPRGEEFNPDGSVNCESESASN